MNYLITENKFDDIMYNYIVKLFENNEKGKLHYTYGYDEYGNEFEDSIEFYFGDYTDDETAFRVYEKEFFPPNSDNINDCPMVEIEYDLVNELETLFSNKWKKQFKKYLKTYYNIDIKTVN